MAHEYPTVPTYVFYTGGRSVLVRTPAEWAALDPGWAEHPDDVGAEPEPEAAPLAEPMTTPMTMGPNGFTLDPDDVDPLTDAPSPKPKRSHHKKQE